MRRGWGALIVLIALTGCGDSLPDDSHAGPSDRATLVATIEVGRAYSVAAGERHVWTANYEDGAVARIDPDRTEIIEEIPVSRILGSGASDLHPAGNHMWLAANDSGTVGHLDTKTSEVTKAVEVGPAGMLDMSSTSDEVWVAQQSANRYLEPTETLGVMVQAANAVVEPPGRFSPYTDIASGDAGTWAIDEGTGTLAAVSPTNGSPRVAASAIAQGAQADLVVGHGYVWVETSDESSTQVTRYNPADGATHTVKVEGSATSIAVGTDEVWLLTGDGDNGVLWRIPTDATEAEEMLTLDGEYQVADIAYGFGSIWVTHDTNLLSRVDVTGEVNPSEPPPTPEARGDAEVCDQTGPWSYCPEARWLRRVAIEAGFDVIGDTGSALELEGYGFTLHAWNTKGATPVDEVAREEGYEQHSGTDVYSDGKRLLWEGQGLHIYVSAADESVIDDLPDDAIDALVTASRSVPMEADLDGAKPQPTPTAEQRFESDGDKVKVWPVTEDVENSGKYLFTAPHCGLDWMVDFDGSFWDAIEPDDYGENPDAYTFFYNSDEGAITFESDDVATYQASTGETIRLERISGPVSLDFCD